MMGFSVCWGIRSKQKECFKKFLSIVFFMVSTLCRTITNKNFKPFQACLQLSENEQNFIS